jgi:hypothetical protein
MKNILLASFVQEADLDKALKLISEKVQIDPSRIFVFKASNEFVLTYNFASLNIEYDAVWPDTIMIHRKKETNTLFSINALNQIIKDENGGVLDIRFSVNWENYKDAILLIRNGKLRVVPISLKKNFS